MANLVADYKQMANIAKTIRSNAQDINDYFTNIYAEIGNMHSYSYWKGKRYNSLVKDFNSITSQINNILDFIVTEVPDGLETAANNYALSNEDDPITVASAKKKQIQNLSTYDTDVGMKFDSENVSNTLSKVESKFNSVKEKMDAISSNFNNLKEDYWTGDASASWSTMWTNMSNNITTSFGNVLSNFKTLMNAALTDIGSAETSNTVQNK